MNMHTQRLTLILEVNLIAGAAPTQPISASFSEQGGSIGRRDDNDWVLPDPERFISGRHAVISFDDGRFFITDVSSNGVFINHADSPIGNDGQSPLQQGDTLTIGEYEIGVSLRESAIQSAEASSFDALDDPYARLLDENAGIQLEPGFTPLDAQRHLVAEPPFSLDETTQPDLESAPPSVPTPPVAAASEADHVSDLNSCFSQASLIPEDWETESAPSPPMPASPPSAPTSKVPHLHSVDGRVSQPIADQIQATPSAEGTRDSVSADQEVLRAALAEGLGLSHAMLDEIPLPELLENLGRIMRSSVEGAMSVLRARAQMKSEFRMSQTMIRPVENNPLKFSVNTEEALRHIIDPKPNSGYLSPMAAFREAHEDAEAHMLAVMVGMQSALSAVIQRFKPDNLEQRLGQSALLEKIPLYRRAKSWELFTRLYGEIANEVEDDFQRLFGRAFSQAYESQIRRLASIKNADNGITTQNRN
jgi:type VI secretion system protein